MDDAHDGVYASEPQLDDLVRVARALNANLVRSADVPIPVASPRTLIRTKDTPRPTDAADRQFLQVLIDEKLDGCAAVR